MTMSTLNRNTKCFGETSKRENGKTEFSNSNWH